MANVPKRSQRPVLSVRQRRLVRFRAQGHSEAKAMQLAGYSKHVRPADVLHRPLVQSALTDALRKQGITLGRIVKPIKDALSATLTSSFMGELRPSKLPDHKTRLEASELAMSLHGGLPKQIELPPLPREPLTVIFESDGHGHARTAVRLGEGPAAARPKTPTERQADQLQVILTGPDAPDPGG